VAPESGELSRKDKKLREHAELEREMAARVMQAHSSTRSRVAADANDRVFRAVLEDRGPQLHNRCFGATPGDPLLARRILGEGKVVLEVGSGFGYLSAELSRTEQLVVGVDISTFAVVEARRATRACKSVEFIAMDAAHLGFRDRSFDGVVSIETLEHLHPDDVPGHLAEVRRVLKPGGRFLLRTPNGALGPSDIVSLAQTRGLLDAEGHGFHLREWTYSELAQELRAAGFRRAWSLPSARPRLAGVGLPAWVTRLRVPLWLRGAQERYVEGPLAQFNLRALGQIKIVEIR
jgi:SAM-dependent methyltransferase